MLENDFGMASDYAAGRPWVIGWIFAYAICLLSSQGGPAFAGLTTTQPVRDVESSMFDASIQGDFTLVDDARVPVRIVDIGASCGCTSIIPDRRQFAPGEVGSVHVKVELGSQTGRLRRLAWLVTDSPDMALVKLQLNVTVPAPASLSPARAAWKLGDNTDYSDIELRPTPSVELVKVRPRPTTQGFDVQIVDQDRDLARIRVKPDSTFWSREGVITLGVTVEAAGRQIERDVYLPVSIDRPPPLVPPVGK